MKTVEDEVRSVVKSFMDAGEMFTALDVSNKVKMTFPMVRHREVRDVVRGMFSSDIESEGWARTPIKVTLGDGSTAEALLYHALNDSWDLDNKYDLQKRNQGTLTPVAVVPTLTTMPVVPSPVTVTVTPTASATTTTVVSTPAALPAKDRWLQLFNTQPSLFPVK